MIPDLVTLVGSPWPVLPPGIHVATFEDIEAIYATSKRRRDLFEGLITAALHLRIAGCTRIFLDGSYVTSKPRPGDYDACWDPTGVERRLLHPAFSDFSNGRAAQKKAFGGEFFPSSIVERQSGRAFLNFFQNDRHTGEPKGIIEVSLIGDALLDRRAI
jgi:hypothetical protein